MTEEEARSKQCCGPFPCGRSLQDQVMGYVSSPERYCIGPACMAWRVTDAESRKVDDQTWISVAGGIGYCGLAGKP